MNDQQSNQNITQYEPETNSAMKDLTLNETETAAVKGGPIEIKEVTVRAHVEERIENGLQRRAYKAVFGEFALRCLFTMAADGKIAGLSLRPLN